MPSTYSNLKIQLMATGENNTTWGDVTNLNLGTALEEAIVGSADVPFSSADVTLTLTDTNASQTARNMRLNLTGTATSGYNLIVPAIEKPYIINNATDGTITVKNATGTGIAVPAGKTMWVYNNGTNVVDAVTRLSSLTLGTDLAVADGGTGASTFTSNGVLVGNGTSAITATAAGTTGQVLVGNTGGAPSWATLSGIGVTSFSAGTTGLTPNSATTGAITLAGTLNVANGGTGATSLTSGYLVKGNGTSAVSASVVYDDGTNVGIGTSSPGNKLSVVGGQINTVADDAYALALNATTGNVRTYPYLSSYSGSALVAFSAGYAGNGPLSIAASTLQLWTGGSERMRVTSAGDVGIGTTTPGAKLALSTNTNNGILIDTPMSSTAYAEVRARYTGQDNCQSAIRFYNPNNAYGGALTLWTQPESNGAAMVERMRIDSSGNVLIGTTTAVDSNLPLELNAGASGLRGMGVNNNGGYGVYLTYDNTGRYSTNGAAIRNIANSPLYFETNNTLRATLDASGNFGFGVTPSGWTTYKSFDLGQYGYISSGAGGWMELMDNTYWNGVYRYKGTGAASHYLQQLGAHSWYTAASGTAGNAISFTQAMTLDASGNLGIGTSSPANKLDVNGNATFRNGSGVTIGTVSNNGGWYEFGASTNVNGVQLWSGSSAQAIRFGGGNTFTEQMRLDASGNLGIGTSSPIAKLEIIQNQAAYSYFDYYNVTNGGGIVWRQIVRNLANTGTTSVDLAKLIGGGFVINNNDTGAANYTAFGIGGTERMRIDSSGNVGIGTTTPRAMLDVGTNASGSTTSTFHLGYSGLNFYGFRIANTINPSLESAGTLSFQRGTTAAWSDVVTISDVGNVGIGTASPSGFGSNITTLDIEGSSGSGIKFGTGSPTFGIYYNGGNAYLQTLNSSPLLFATNNSEAMRIDTSGNLLVGATATTSYFDGKFNVDGRVHIRGNASTLGALQVLYTTQTSGTDNLISFYYGSTPTFVGYISTNGTSTSYATSSDARLKENIAPADDAAALIDAIQVRKFDWKADGSHQRYGMVAQELLEVAPEAVSVPADEDEMMGVDYSKLVPMLIAEIQSLRARVAQLEGN